MIFCPSLRLQIINCSMDPVAAAPNWQDYKLPSRE